MRGLLTGLVLENLLYTNIGIYPASHDQQARVKTLSKVLWEIKFNQNWMSPKGMSSGQGCVHLWIPLTFHTSSPHSFHNSLSPFWTEKTKVLWQLPPHPHHLAYQPPASVQHILLSHLSPAPFKAKPTASHFSPSQDVILRILPPPPLLYHQFLFLCWIIPISIQTSLKKIFFKPPLKIKNTSWLLLDKLGTIWARK